MSRGLKVFESRGFHGNDGPEHAARIKEKAAALWEELANIPVPPGNMEAGRLRALAQTDLESSVMWGVKALSRNAAEGEKRETMAVSPA